RQQKEVEKDLRKIEEDDPAKPTVLAESSEPGTDSYIADTHTRIMALGEQLKRTNQNIKKLFKKLAKELMENVKSVTKKLRWEDFWLCPQQAIVYYVQIVKSPDSYLLPVTR